MQKLIFIIIILCHLLIPSIAICEQYSIVNIKKVFHIINNNKAQIDIVITNNESEPIYKILCRPDDYEDSDFDYTGLLQCRMISMLKRPNSVDTDLLSQPDATRDWLSRGLFDIRQLTGNCKDDTDFGSVRTFNLRGMSITFSLFNLKEHNNVSINKSSDKYYSYDFSVAVINDKNANSNTDRLVPWPELRDNLLDCKSKSPWR